MAAPRKKQDDKNLQILRELLGINGNKYCFDCNQRGPTYVNSSIGSFVCSKCSGMLRGLSPPHRVKSISLATFTPEELDFIKKRGNDYCKRVWLGLYDGESAELKDEQSVKDFMSDKYEKKRYYLEPSSNGHVNGFSLSKVKSALSKSDKNSAPLVAISPTSNGVTNNKVVSASKPINSVLPIVNNNSYAAPQPTTTVPEFAVDFSTAKIYNSSQFNNNNSFSTSTNSNHINGFNNSPVIQTTQKQTQNDRYAALADLDSEYRQQNILKCLAVTEPKEPQQQRSNPFQSLTNGDFFSNGVNPFGNGNMWNTEPSHMQFNPFATPAGNGASFTNSKNPFL